MGFDGIHTRKITGMSFISGYEMVYTPPAFGEYTVGLSGGYIYN